MLSKKLLQTNSGVNLTPASDSNAANLVLAYPFNNEFGLRDMSYDIKSRLGVVSQPTDTLNMARYLSTTANITTSDYKFYGSSLQAGDPGGGPIRIRSESNFAGLTNTTWTIEFWLKIPVTGSQSFSPFYYESGGQGLNIAIDWVSTGINYNRMAVLVNTQPRVRSTIQLPTNTWFHVAVTRNGSYNYLWINGVNRGQEYAVTSTSVTSDKINLLTGFDTNQDLTKMQDFRLYDSVAKYTSSFTPPGAMYI